MTPEQQAQEASEFLTAYIASKRDVTKDVEKWFIQGTEHLGCFWRRLLWTAGEWRTERCCVGGKWHWPKRCPDHEAAALILLAFQQRLDEAKVEVRGYSHRPIFVVCRLALMDYLGEDGYGPLEYAIEFSSRPLAMLAAIQALET